MDSWIPDFNLRLAILNEVRLPARLHQPGRPRWRQRHLLLHLVLLGRNRPPLHGSRPDRHRPVRQSPGIHRLLAGRSPRPLPPLRGQDARKGFSRSPSPSVPGRSPGPPGPESRGAVLDRLLQDGSGRSGARETRRRYRVVFVAVPTPEFMEPLMLGLRTRTRPPIN